MVDERTERLINIIGYIGRILVIVGMACGCILIWTFIFRALL